MKQSKGNKTKILKTLKKSETFRLLIVFIIVITIIYLLNVQKKSSANKVEYGTEITLANDLPDSRLKDPDPPSNDDVISNVINNTNVFSDYYDSVKWPVSGLQKVQSETSNYLVNAGYKNQSLLIITSTYLQIGTKIYFDCSIGNTGDTISITYSTWTDKFSFYIKKA